MVAKITLEYDDQTDAGFRSLVRNLEQAERGQINLADATHRENMALMQMQKTQMASTAAIAANTAAVRDNRDSFMEASNTAVQFTKNIIDLNIWSLKVAGAIGATSVKVADLGVNVGLFDSRASAAGFAAKSLALHILDLGSPVFGATAGMTAFNVVAERTGERLRVLSTSAPQHIRNLADQVTNGFITIEEAQERVGASIDELGLKYENNASRIAAAQGKLVDTFVDDLSTSFAWVGDIVDDIGRTIDDEMTRFAGNVERNSELLMKFDDMRTGRDTASRKENERLAEYNKRIAEGRAAMDAFNVKLNDQMKLRRELFEISQLQTREEVQAAREAEREKRSEILNTGQTKTKVGEASNARMEAIRRRDAEITEAAERKKLDAFKRAESERIKIIQKNRDAERAAFAEDFKQRQAYAKKQMELEELVAAGKAGLRLQENLDFLELLKQKLELQGGHEKEIIAIEKTAAQQRLKFASEQSKTEEERVRARFEYQRRLREIDLQHAKQTQQKQFDAAKAAADKTVEEHKKAVDAIKNYRDKEGRNAFEHIVSKQKVGDVREQIAQQRIEAAKKDKGGDLSRQQQMQLERNVRQQLFRDSKAGRVDKAEVARAQAEVAKRQIEQARESGQFNQSQVNATRALANEFVKERSASRQMRQDLDKITQLVKSSNNMHPRRRAQR